MNLLCFVIWLCFYPVCSAVSKYAIASYYAVNKWEYFDSMNSSKFKSLFNFIFYVVVALFLFFNL